MASKARTSAVFIHQTIGNQWRNTKTIKRHDTTTMCRLFIWQDDQGSMANKVQIQLTNQRSNKGRAMRISRPNAINANWLCRSTQRQIDKAAIHSSNSFRRPLFKAALRPFDETVDIAGNHRCQTSIRTICRQSWHSRRGLSRRQWQICRQCIQSSMRTSTTNLKLLQHQRPLPKWHSRTSNSRYY